AGAVAAGDGPVARDRPHGPGRAGHRRAPPPLPVGGGAGLRVVSARRRSAICSGAGWRGTAGNRPRRRAAGRRRSRGPQRRGGRRRTVKPSLKKLTLPPRPLGRGGACFRTGVTVSQILFPMAIYLARPEPDGLLGGGCPLPAPCAAYLGLLGGGGYRVPPAPPPGRLVSMALLQLMPTA